jgi:DNA-directed RNA polymerase subunit RPC12/RpoP
MKCVYCGKPVQTKSTQVRDRICGTCWSLLIQIAKSQPVLRRAQ